MSNKKTQVRGALPKKGESAWGRKLDSGDWSRVQPYKQRWDKRLNEKENVSLKTKNEGGREDKSSGQKGRE